MSIEWVHGEVAAINVDAATAAEARQGQLTKPPGSLGRLERLAVRQIGRAHV